jgi:hypothetical protein
MMEKTSVRYLGSVVEAAVGFYFITDFSWLLE